MPRLTLIIFLIVIGQLYTRAQQSDSIIYILPDQVEIKLNSHIEKIYTYDPNRECYFYLEKTNDENFRIFVGTKSKDTIWANFSNRYVVVNNRKISLIFDYDLIWSTKNTENIGSFGKRAGEILKTKIIYDGYNITFDRNGKCLEEDFGIYKKE